MHCAVKTLIASTVYNLKSESTNYQPRYPLLLPAIGIVCVEASAMYCISCDSNM